MKLFLRTKKNPTPSKYQVYKHYCLQACLIFLLVKLLDLPSSVKYGQVAEDVKEADHQAGHHVNEGLGYLMRMFGQKAKDNVATDPKYWRPPCKVSNPDALSAIRRARTEQCGRELTTAACMVRDNIPFPDFIPR